MTLREFLYAARELIQDFLDRIGLAWTRTFHLLAEGRTDAILSFDLFIIAVCVLVAAWIVAVESQSRGTRR